jgi:hypothetical protein
MSKSLKLSFSMLFITLLTTIALIMSVGAVHAAETTLTLNSGSTITSWVITGESSLVINGFDLQSFNVARPTTVNGLRISVRAATPGIPLEAVVYQDANGGSPVDARLVGRKSVDIQTAGVAEVRFDAPLTITERFLWVGFYMPVGFEFGGDDSGSSVLTYWAWTPNGIFDLNNLGSAAVFGAADGSAPVTINMGGKARINVLVDTDSVVTTGTPAGTSAGATPVPNVTPMVTQIVGDPNTSFAPMVAYQNCGTLLYDTADIAVTYRGNVQFQCKVVPNPLRPEAPDGYNRQGPLFDVYVFGIPSGIEPLPYAVTHCLKPRADELNIAVMGVGHGAPRQWDVLPTVRFGEYICAEIGYAGFISYFVPR